MKALFECIVEGCDQIAIDGRDYCYTHLPEHVVDKYFWERDGAVISTSDNGIRDQLTIHGIVEETSDDYSEESYP